MATSEPPPQTIMGLDMADVEDQLVCEGYLKKIRGFIQNRRRWFRLTATTIAFYDRDGGKLIHGINRAFVTGILDAGRRRFRLECSVAFGASGSKSMLLEAPSVEVKNKWLTCLKQQSIGEGFRAQQGRLFAEGYLNKLQQLGSMNRVRWFVYTDRQFAYFREEAGEFMAACPVDQIETVTPKGDLSFRLLAKQPFTKTGAKEVICQCESEAVRDKWLSVMTRTLAATVRHTEFSPLPDKNRALDDHFGIAARERAEFIDQDASEGNRFIRNHEL